MWSPCTPLPEFLQFQCAGDEKNPSAGCGFKWLGVPWQEIDLNSRCPNCGHWSPWDADIAEYIELSDVKCATQNE